MQLRFHEEILLVCGDGEIFLIDLPEDPVTTATIKTNSPPVSHRGKDQKQSKPTEDVNEMLGFLTLDTDIPMIDPDLLSPTTIEQKKQVKEEKQKVKEEKLREQREQKLQEKKQRALEREAMEKEKEQKALQEKEEKRARAQEREELARKEKEEKAKAKELKLEAQREKKRLEKEKKAEQEALEREARAKEKKEKEAREQELQAQQQEIVDQEPKEIVVEVVGQWTRPRAPTVIREALGEIETECISTSKALFVAPDPLYKSLQSGEYRKHKIVAETAESSTTESEPSIKSPGRKTNPLVVGIKIPKNGILKKLVPRKDSRTGGGSCSPRRLSDGGSCSPRRKVSPRNDPIEKQANQPSSPPDLLTEVKQKPLPKPPGKPAAPNFKKELPPPPVPPTLASSGFQLSINITSKPLPKPPSTGGTACE